MQVHYETSLRRTQLRLTALLRQITRGIPAHVLEEEASAFRSEVELWGPDLKDLASPSSCAPPDIWLLRLEDRDKPKDSCSGRMAA